MFETVVNWLEIFVKNKDVATTFAIIVLSGALVLIAMIANGFTKMLINVYVRKLVQTTRIKWDNIIYERHIFTRLSHLVPMIVISVGSKLIFIQQEHNAILVIISKFVSIYFVMMTALIIHSVLSAVVEIYQTYEMSKLRPINSYIQVLKIILWVFAGVASISILLNKDLWALFLGMGGMMAIVMLVFKDSILGLVAGVQITANDMLRLDDWLEMPSRGADGDVVEITLNTVKVRNWDKTITTIPTDVLIKESFKNWRGMTESGGRRIKRAVSIDMNSVVFCNEEMLNSFMKIQLLSDHLIRKQKEIGSYNEETGVDTSSLANGRRMTNLGCFRAYLVAYLRNHPKIHKDMTFLVRHLTPGPTGLPIEIYVFSNDQEWANYEAIQADIFDHILAVIPEFSLRVFQNPTGSDFMRALRPSS